MQVMSTVFVRKSIPFEYTVTHELDGLLHRDGDEESAPQTEVYECELRSYDSTNHSSNQRLISEPDFEGRGC